jgi:hypothetical protein
VARPGLSVRILVERFAPAGVRLAMVDRAPRRLPALRTPAPDDIGDEVAEDGTPPIVRDIRQSVVWLRPAADLRQRNTRTRPPAVVT